MDRENTLVNKKHVFICIEDQLINVAPSYLKELEFIKNNFYGIVSSDLNKLNDYPSDTIIYMGGDIDYWYVCLY